MQKILMCTSLIALWGMSAEALKYYNDSEEDVIFTSIVGTRKTDVSIKAHQSNTDVSSESLNLLIATWKTEKEPNLTYIKVTVKAPGLQPLPCTLDGREEIPVAKADTRGFDNVLKEIEGHLTKKIITFTYDKHHHVNSKCEVLPAD